MTTTTGGAVAGRRRQTPAEPATPDPADGRAGSRAGSGGRSTASTPDVFGLERGDFTPPDDPDAGATAGAELENDGDYEPPKPELIEWTPERAASVIRAGGFVLHAVDPLADEDGGEQLWRATQADIDAMGPPLARILNRYAPARRLAGYSDEGELAIGFVDYMRRNAATRGRLRAQRKARLEAEQPTPAAGFFGGPQPGTDG